MVLKINDKEYALEWGLGAIEIFCDAMDCDLEGLDKVIMPNRDQPKAITHLILAALQNAAELNDQELDVNYRQLQKHLSNMPQDDFAKVMKDFRRSQYFGKTIGEYLGVPDEEETKVVKKKSRSARSSS